MIDGITILNQYLYTNIAGIVAAIVLVILLLLFLGIFIFLAVDAFSWSETLCGIVWVIFAIGIFIGTICSINCVIKLSNTHTTRYEVTIEDSVSFNDVMENYEIIDQDGQIWTIEVKEKEE